MKDYIAVMMTARGCGHCAHSRGNGIMGTGPHFMKPTAIDEMLSIDNNMILLNIHFESMAGKKQQIREISKFSKNEDIIKQEFWAIDENNTVRMHIITANTKTKQISQQSIDTVKSPNGDPIVWEQFVDSKIPDKIENYAYYYPCFMIMRTQNWINSIEKKEELYALTNAGKTRKDLSGKVFLDRDGKSFNERMVEPKKLFEDVMTGKVQIAPHIIDERKEPHVKKEEVVKPASKPQKEEVVKPASKPQKEEVVKPGKYIIEQY